jgi:glyoxylase-like metal-dependent hydrolase (beta-lactamase superfamily II)
MRIHHLNCGTLCPYGGYVMDGTHRGLGPTKLVCHCLLVESSQGLVLVDTGLGTGDIARPQRISGFFRTVLRPKLDEEETALRRVVQLGFDPSDVRHIVVTHLDFDHAGGISDFSSATIHVHAREHRAALERRGFIGRRRYRPAQWTNGITWREYDSFGERWYGFESVRQLEGLPPEILLIPLIGHTRGHSGVAVQADSGWLLHAGDAYFHRAEISGSGQGTPGLEAYQTMMEVDRKARRTNRARLRELALAHPEVRVFSAHDAVELDLCRREERREAARAPIERPDLRH